MRHIVLIAGVCLMIASAFGCGSEEVNGQAASTEQHTLDGTEADRPGSSDEVGQAPAQTKREIRGVINRLNDPERVCNQMTDRFLEYTYGASGDKGRRRCQREVQGQGKEPEEVQEVRFLTVRPRSASTVVTDARGSKAKFRFVLVKDRWLLDSVSSL